MLTDRSVSEWSFCFLILVSVFVGIWVAYSDRVKQFTLSVGEMKMVLAEVKEAKKDVELRETRIKEIAMVSAEVVAHIAAFYGRAGSEESHKLNRLWLAARVKRLAAITDRKISGAAWDFIDAVNSVDESDPKHGELVSKAWEKAYAKIRSEISES